VDTLGFAINLFQQDGAPQLIVQVERVEDARRELEGKGVALLDYTIEHGES
jgi:hypothetical protein